MSSHFTFVRLSDIDFSFTVTVRTRPTGAEKNLKLHFHTQKLKVAEKLKVNAGPIHCPPQAENLVVCKCVRYLKNDVLSIFL